MNLDWEKLKERVGDINPVYTDEKIPNQRLEICKQCEYYEESPLKRCTNCGCFLDAKIRVKRISCPINKW